MRDDWLSDQIDYYYDHFHRDLTDEQLDWYEYIYDTYADEDGYVDWDDRTRDSAWYTLLSEIYDMSDEDIEKYME